MLNVSINLSDRFPLTDGVRLKYLLKELDRHAYSTNGEANSGSKPPVTFSPELTIDKHYTTPDKIKISLHHSPTHRDSYVCFHGKDTMAVDLLSEVFFYSLNYNFSNNNFSFRQQSNR